MTDRLSVRPPAHRSRRPSWSLVAGAVLCRRARPAAAVGAPGRRTLPPSPDDLDAVLRRHARRPASRFTGAMRLRATTAAVDGAPDVGARSARRGARAVLAKIDDSARIPRMPRSMPMFQKRVSAVSVADGRSARGRRRQARMANTPAPPSRRSRRRPQSAGRRRRAGTEVGLRVSVRQLRLGQPSVVGGRVFVGGDTGFVYALDAATGCVHWSFRARAGVRTAPTIGAGDGAHRFLAYFGDIKGSVYAVDAETGVEVWTARVDTHPVARVTGAPKLAAGRLFVPLSSLEESGAGNPSYPCCTFRGGVAAYDARTGARLWKNFTVADEPQAHQAHLRRHPAVGASRRRRVVVTDGGPRAAGRLSGDRQRLHPAGRHRLRCRDCLRPGHRQAPVGRSR